MEPHRHRVRIYYEDTDVSGFVYHANYLRYFERAREHLLGPAELIRLLEEDGITFLVYRAELAFKEGARLGDVIEIRSTVELASQYRLRFHQLVFREGRDAPSVDGTVELVCVDRSSQLVRVPASVQARLQSR